MDKKTNNNNKNMDSNRSDRTDFADEINVDMDKKNNKNK